MERLQTFFTRMAHRSADRRLHEARRWVAFPVREMTALWISMLITWGPWLVAIVTFGWRGVGPLGVLAFSSIVGAMSHGFVRGVFGNTEAEKRAEAEV